MAVQPFLDGSTIKLPGQARDIHRKIAAEVGGMKSVIPVPECDKKRKAFFAPQPADNPQG